MLARFYIEDTDFTGVDVLKDVPVIERERVLEQIELRTEMLGFLIFALLIVGFPVLSLLF